MSRKESLTSSVASSTAHKESLTAPEESSIATVRSHDCDPGVVDSSGQVGCPNR
jgi:hypothetical protein